MWTLQFRQHLLYEFQYECKLSKLIFSVIQALSNTYPSLHYFTSGAHVTDLNVNNPLSSKGALTNAFGALLKELWSNKFIYVGQ